MRVCIEDVPTSWAVFDELTAGRTAWGLAAAFGVGLVSGVFGVGGGWALVPVFNLVMGLPLKVACSEATIALGDVAAATYLSAGFRPDFLVSTQVGVALGAFLGAWVAAFGAGGAAGGFGGLLLAAATP
jgi:uncharacterized membrane protein YfcA